MPANYPNSVASFPTRITGNAIPASDHNGPASEITAIETALLTGFDHIVQALGFQFETAATKVLASDTLTLSGESYVSVDTQGAAASDTLSTITAGAPTHGMSVADGFLLLLKPENASHVVTVTSSGNIVLASDMVFSALTDRLLLQYNGTNWIEICRSPNAIPGINTSTDGKPKFTNRAGTSGVVVDVNTDGTAKVYQRDGTTLGSFQSGTVSDSVGSMATLRSDIAAISSPYQLLYAQSGTSTDTSARVIDSYALASQLTVLDTLIVEITLSNSAGSVGQPFLYNSTDSVSLGGATGYNLGSTSADIWSVRITCAANNAKKVAAFHSFTTGGTAVTVGAQPVFTTNATGNWTLQLKQVSASAGTVSWSWRIYRLKGQ